MARNSNYSEQQIHSILYQRLFDDLYPKLKSIRSRLYHEYSILTALFATALIYYQYFEAVIRIDLALLYGALGLKFIRDRLDQLVTDKIDESVHKKVEDIPKEADHAYREKLNKRFASKLNKHSEFLNK